MIRLELPLIPPSLNNAYFNRPHGGRVLTKAGKNFKNLSESHLSRTYPQELRFFQANKPYLIVIRFFFEDVETKGFASGKAKNRYKVFDGGNRTKLLEDVLKDVGGIDDSQTLTSIWEKKQGLPERTLLWAWNLEEEATPFDGTLASLT